MRLIDADANKATMLKCAENPESMKARLCYLFAARIFEEAPTVDAVPVVHAYWTTKRTWQHDGEIYCSACDHDAPTEGDYRQVKTNYCPNCGAKMDGERKDGDRK